MKIGFWVVLVLFVLSLGGLWYSNAYWKNKYVKELKIEKEKLTDSLIESFKTTEKIIDKAEKATNVIKKRSKNIDDKLKEDEKIIDSRPVSNDKLDSLLTRFD